MTVGVYDNCYTCWNGCPADPGNQGFCGYSSRADTDGTRLNMNTAIADIDIVTADKEIEAGVSGTRLESCRTGQRSPRSRSEIKI